MSTKGTLRNLRELNLIVSHQSREVHASLRAHLIANPTAYTAGGKLLKAKLVLIFKTIAAFKP